MKTVKFYLSSMFVFCLLYFVFCDGITFSESDTHHTIIIKFQHQLKKCKVYFVTTYGKINSTHSVLYEMKGSILSIHIPKKRLIQEDVSFYMRVKHTSTSGKQEFDTPNFKYISKKKGIELSN